MSMQSHGCWPEPSFINCLWNAEGTALQYKLEQTTIQRVEVVLLHWNVEICSQYSHTFQYLSAPNRILEDSQDSWGLHCDFGKFKSVEKNSVKSSGFLRTTWHLAICDIPQARNKKSHWDNMNYLVGYMKYPAGRNEKSHLGSLK